MRMRCSSWMRRASSRRARSPRGWRGSTAARQGGSRTAMPPRGYPGVFLVYAAPRGSAFLDRALYLPKAWTADAERCQEAGIPDTVGFATKGDLAKAMLARAFAAAVPARWVVADEVYGNDGALRRWLHEQERAYVLGVGRGHMIWSGETWTEEWVGDA